ncbi:putative MHC class I antigen protein, partial [Naja naja]
FLTLFFLSQCPAGERGSVSPGDSTNHLPVPISGLHTLQSMYGCELWRDGSKGGFMQEGYDGRTFITFDKETFTWVAPDPQAQITQRKRDTDPGYNLRWKSYLEEICIEWLEKYLSYGNETLLRTVRSMPPDEGGEVWEEETFHGSVAPNADGTYHSWLSIRIDPKERGRYRCHVEHDGLQEPLDLALEEPTNSKYNLGLIIVCVVAALLLVFLVISVVLVVMKSRILVSFKRRQDYRAAARSDKGSNSSGRGSNRLFSSPIAVETPSIKREE